MKLSAAMERLDILRDDNTPENVLALPSLPCHSLPLSLVISTSTPAPTPTPAIQFDKRATTPPDSIPPWVSSWASFASEYPNLGPGGHPPGAPPNLGASNTASTSTTSSSSSATSSSDAKSSASAMTTETSTSTVIVESVSTINPPQSTAQNSTLGATSHPIEAFSKGALAGIIIGSLIALALISLVLFLLFYIRRRRARNGRGPVEGEVVAQIRVRPPPPSQGRSAGGRGVISEDPPDDEEYTEDKTILAARDRALSRTIQLQRDQTHLTHATADTRPTFSSYPYSIEPPPTPTSTGAGGGVGRDFGSYGPATPSSRALPSSERSRSPFSPTSDSNSLSLPGAPYPTRSDPSPTQRSGTGTRERGKPTRTGLRVSTGPLGQNGGQGAEGEGGEGERHRDGGSLSDREREEYDGPALVRSPSGRLPPAYQL
ncbi:hypothetical protein SISNIDRAFT_460133 [Sistotremastrum niveocremeum HHB9708]|uniref:Mid2 domain-containing protein n=2 Tax=Sistotremastraceae TaxID=3402574 RepID=A0A164NVB9_9AGAM|nr:hypothetical protein SISNIDRAFT_460133 [Sistotremastrum niveocremeum HHB9708]KZT40500.1 hypothetical protein SISSUDRAFT_1044217 [Sistotremastrum suecicum HHB10207 ss-3]